ncbi:hypothetical protein OROMI_027853 [Orobanche minor]
MSPSCLIVVHGGHWDENIYVGGRKECIPIPPTGMTFEQFSSKLEVRLKKDNSMYAFDLDALVQSPVGETMRMKITNDFELCSMLEMLDLPTIYITVYPLMNECSSSRERRNKIQCEIDVGNDEPIFENVGDKISDNKFHDLADVFEGCDDSDDYCSGDEHNQSNTIINEGKQKEVRLWMIPGAAEQATIASEDFVIHSEPVTNELVIGVIFHDKLTMTTAVGYYHMKNHVESVTARSSGTRYHLVCKFRGRCEFVIRASALGRAWKINQFRPHNCEFDFRYHPHPKVSSKVVAAEFVDNFTEDGFLLRPLDIQGKLLRDHGVHVTYRTALAGKNHAIKESYGDADKSFQLLPTYLYMLKELNPGSIVALQTCDDGIFQFVFFALGACIRGFSSCRPVIVIDGTHLKGKYKGIMFIAATKDANEQIVPLAFGIGDKENDSSWTWFLQQVRNAFGCPADLLIVSDQHLSIKNGVDLVYPGTPHGLCSFHIQTNMKKWGYGSYVTDIFQAAATAYKPSDFEEHVANLQQTAPRAHARVINLDPRRWAVCKCPVRRSQELSEYATERLQKAIELGRSMKVEPISDIKYKVVYGSHSHMVDLAVRECSCHVFDLDLIPCSHAAAAISFARQSPVSYVHRHYSTQTWLDTYAGEVMPIPDKDEWLAPDYVTSRVVGTPPNPRQAGRPRGNRIQSGHRVCSRCHKKGHYQNTCITVLEEIPREEEVSSNQPKIRKKNKCGICGVEGHTRITCEDPNRFG